LKQPVSSQDKSIALHDALPILAECYRDYPDSHLIIEPSDTLDAIELVRTGKVDLAITVEPKNERELEFHPFFTDELAFFVASSQDRKSTRLNSSHGSHSYAVFR